MNELQKFRSRQLRKFSSDAERVLWQKLRNRQVSNQKFRRQHSIGSYIVDFVCLERQLVVEIDGSQHLQQQDYDQRRTDYLEQKGFMVIRFWNHQVLKEIDVVLEVIYSKITSPHPNPLPKGRGDRRKNFTSYLEE